MSTSQVARQLSVFVFCLLGSSILVDGVTEAEGAVASPLMGAILLGSGLLIFFVPKIIR